LKNIYLLQQRTNQPTPIKFPSSKPMCHSTVHIQILTHTHKRSSPPPPQPPSPPSSSTTPALSMTHQQTHFCLYSFGPFLHLLLLTSYYYTQADAPTAGLFATTSKLPPPPLSSISSSSSSSSPSLSSSSISSSSCPRFCSMLSSPC